MCFCCLKYEEQDSESYMLLLVPEESLNRNTLESWNFVFSFFLSFVDFLLNFMVCPHQKKLNKEKDAWGI